MYGTAHLDSYFNNSYRYETLSMKLQMSYCPHKFSTFILCSICTNHLYNAIGTKQHNGFIILWHGQPCFGTAAKLAISNRFLGTGTPASLVPFTCYCPFVYYVIAEPVLLFYKPLPLSCTSRCLGCARLRRRHDQSGRAKWESVYNTALSADLLRAFLVS